jgi:polar amino acid transport system substrate-binding protein
LALVNRRVVLLIAVTALAAVACGSSSSTKPSVGTTAAPAPTTAAAAPTTAPGPTFTPRKAGVLTVATNLPADGFWNGDSSDPTNTAKLKSGFEYDTATELAHRLGLGGISVINVNFDQITNGNKLDADLALSQVTITDARKQAVDFSSPYFEADQGILVRKGTTVDGHSIKSLRLGAQEGTTGADYITKTIKPTKPGKTYKQVVDVTQALQAKDIDAIILDTPIVLQIASTSSGALQVVGQFHTGEQYGAVLPKGSPNTAAVTAAFTAMDAAGFFKTLYAKYFGGDPAKVPVFTVS